MISETVYLHYLNSILDGDKKQCIQIVNNLLDQKESIKEIYLKLFQRSMYRIGTLWEKERCSISEEHIATKITESLIDLVSNSVQSVEPSGKTAVITCIDKEYHELGARMVAGYLDANGWNTFFVGSNTPQSEVIRLIREKEPDIVGISSSFYINIMRLVKLIKLIKEEFPEQKILVGGQSLTDGRSEGISKINGVRYISSIDELDNYILATNQN
jgi:MerR family transcriptional regulator, light-induced transcriptional regulator